MARLLTKLEQTNIFESAARTVRATSSKLAGHTQHPKIQTISIKSRRFLGNKYKLLEFIDSIVKQEAPNAKVYCDIFAGTGVVGAYFNRSDTRVISNDILYSNFIPLQAFLATKVLDKEALVDKITHLNNLTPSANYFSLNFGNKYFSKDNAELIGSIRNEIDHIASNEEEKTILLTSLLYAADKAANTVGHYDAYRKKITETKRVVLQLPLINYTLNHNNRIYNEDANKLIRRIKCDVLYLDPPYNSRQYSDSYHLLENLIQWEKPQVYGKARKMDRAHIKSKYSLKSAPAALKDLVEHANTKHILLSYNSTGSSRDGRSNARISDTEIVGILKSKGTVKIFEKDYRAFTTGKSSSDGNLERIFYCKVR